MGKHFGELAFIRGIIYYKLSPHEQKPFANAFSRGLPNFVPRIMSRIYTWLPAFVLGYTWYHITEEIHWQYQRKNPLDYANEVDPKACPEPPISKIAVKKEAEKKLEDQQKEL